MKQFPVVVPFARTIDKLQGRTLDCVVIVSWYYTGNWMYGALSRMKSLNGLFLLMPLEHHKCKGMPHALRTFWEKIREKGPTRLHNFFDSN